MKKLLDKEIRKALIPILREKYPKHKLVEEMYCFSTRADIALLSQEDYTGIEIKSEGDTLKRLDRQIKEYSRLFQRIIIVVSDKLYNSKDREYWDKYQFFHMVVVVRVSTQTVLSGHPHHTVSFSYKKEKGEEGWSEWNGQLPKKARYTDEEKEKIFKDLTSLLWRGELVDVLNRYHPTRMKNKTSLKKSQLLNHAREVLTERTARYEVLLRSGNGPNTAESGRYQTEIGCTMGSIKE